MRDDIFEGLKFAISKGETLQQAMQSFYNSGYKKEEIEEAARAFQMWQSGHPIQPEPVQQSQAIKKTETLTEKPKGKIQEWIEKILPPKVAQFGAEEKQKPQTLAMILLGFVLLLLIFALVGVLLFKQDVVKFLTGKIIDLLS